MNLTTTLIAVACALPLAAAAQNIATVNGKPVPKARVDTLMEQAANGGQQQRTPELEQRVRDEVVIREIFMQEAETRGLAGTPDYQNQMELARQTILIRELFTDFQKKNPVTEQESRAEYDKFKSQAQASGNTEYRVRHILVEKEDQAKALIGRLKKGEKFEDLAKKNSKDPGLRGQRRRPRLGQPEQLRAGVQHRHDGPEEGRDHAHPGEEPVRLPHHQAGRHPPGAVPRLRGSEGRRSTRASARRSCSSSRKSCAPRPRPTTSSARRHMTAVTARALTPPPKLRPRRGLPRCGSGGCTAPRWRGRASPARASCRPRG